MYVDFVAARKKPPSKVAIVLLMGFAAALFWYVALFIGGIWLVGSLLDRGN
jgi:hypothetical protein